MMSWSGFLLGQEDYFIFMLRINRDVFVPQLCTLPSMVHFVCVGHSGTGRASWFLGKATSLL